MKNIKQGIKKEEFLKIYQYGPRGISDKGTWRSLETRNTLGVLLLHVHAPGFSYSAVIFSIDTTDAPILIRNYMCPGDNLLQSIVCIESGQ